MQETKKLLIAAHNTAINEEVDKETKEKIIEAIWEICENEDKFILSFNHITNKEEWCETISGYSHKKEDTIWEYYKKVFNINYKDPLELVEKYSHEIEVFDEWFGIPDDISMGISEKVFLNLFNDFLKNRFEIITEYKNFSNPDGIKDALIKAANSELDIPAVKDLVELVDYYKPYNQPFKNNQKIFIMEIFESREDGWSEEQFEIINEEFYNIEFDIGSDIYKDIDNKRVKDEVEHINKMQKLYPNYRHD